MSESDKQQAAPTAAMRAVTDFEKHIAQVTIEIAAKEGAFGRMIAAYDAFNEGVRIGANEMPTDGMPNDCDTALRRGAELWNTHFEPLMTAILNDVKGQWVELFTVGYAHGQVRRYGRSIQLSLLAKAPETPEAPEPAASTSTADES